MKTLILNYESGDPMIEIVYSSIKDKDYPLSIGFKEETYELSIDEVEQLKGFLNEN